MSKVLGCKVENNLYNLFDRLPGSKSENLRRAIIAYINKHHNKPVNVVNRVETVRTYRDLVEWVDNLDNLNESRIKRFFEVDE